MHNCSLCGHPKVLHSPLTGYCRWASEVLFCKCYHYREKDEGVPVSQGAEPAVGSDGLTSTPVQEDT